MRFVGGLVLALVLTGCGSLRPRDFADSPTAFEPDHYFTGHVASWGVIENRGGQPMERFTTDCVGRRGADGELTLQQTIHFERRKEVSRVFHIRRLDAHRYAATATDIVGTSYGECFGNAFHWRYRVAENPGNPLARVTFDQWMYLPSGTNTMCTRVIVSKLGLRLAQISEVYHRVETGGGSSP